MGSVKLLRIPLVLRPTLAIYSRLAVRPHRYTRYTTMAYSTATQTALDSDVPYGKLQVSEHQSLALSESEDDADIRGKYRPFILAPDTADDWVNNLELSTVLDMAENDLRDTNRRLKVLVLYGSLRRRSYSKLVAFEACRILFRLGCDVRVFDPEGLPMKNDVDHGHQKVQELRELSRWSDGHVWVSPEQHGNLVSKYFPLLLCHHLMQ
jgi:arsenical resistance protein ArsH